MRLKPATTRTTDTGDGESEPAYFVLGGEQVGESIARQLDAAGETVRFVDETAASSAPGTNGDPADVRVLEDAGVSAGSRVVVATARDSRNLLIAQLVRSHLEVSEILVLVNDPDRAELVEAAGHVPTCATTALSEAVVADLADMDHRVDQRA